MLLNLSRSKPRQQEEVKQNGYEYEESEDEAPRRSSRAFQPPTPQQHHSPEQHAPFPKKPAKLTRRQSHQDTRARPSEDEAPTPKPPKAPTPKKSPIKTSPPAKHQLPKQMSPELAESEQGETILRLLDLLK